MLELQHPQEPESLAKYREEHSDVILGQDAWHGFRGDPSHVFYDVRRSLLAMQNNRCVYCERSLKEGSIQVEHINPRCDCPAETFIFTNLAVCCLDGKPLHCGESKRDRHLPIKPYPGCNANFNLITGSGELVPAFPEVEEKVISTLSILKLNIPALTKARQDRIRGLEVACDEIWRIYKSEEMMGEYIRSEYESGEFPSCVRQVFSRFFE